MTKTGRGLLAAVVAVAVILFGVVTFRALRKADDGPRVVNDTAFVRAANEECRSTLPGLRPPTTRNQDDVVSPARAADGVDRAADGLVGLADRLQALPVAAADAPRVRGWLDGWRAYADVGHRYAALLRAGDVAGGQKAAQHGNPIQLRLDRFSRANGLDDCQLYVLLRAPEGGGSPI